MHWFIVAWALSVGYLPSDFSCKSTPTAAQLIYDDSKSYSLDLALELRAFSHLRAYGDIETFAYQRSILGYCPVESQYRVGFELYSCNFALGIRHECDHPTISNPWPKAQLLGEKTELYLTIRGETSF
jgi:hypothetical protein